MANEKLGHISQSQKKEFLAFLEKIEKSLDF